MDGKYLNNAITFHQTLVQLQDWRARFKGRAPLRDARNAIEDLRSDSGGSAGTVDNDDRPTSPPARPPGEFLENARPQQRNIFAFLLGKEAMRSTKRAFEAEFWPTRHVTHDTRDKSIRRLQTDLSKFGAGWWVEHDAESVWLSPPPSGPNSD